MKKLRKLLGLVLIFLTSCSLPGIGMDTNNDVIVATGSTTERQILGNIVAQMIRHYTDLNVGIISNLGSTTLINVAMIKGDLNVSGGMYTGTSLTGELGMKPIKDPEKALKTVQVEYLKRYNRKWYPSFGFANTYAFMVKKDLAQKYDLKKVSDLEKIKDQIKVGVDTSWINRPGDGYKGFQEIYGFSFNKLYPMEISLVYTALAENEMDVVLGYSTDGRINTYGLILLEDDKRLFPPYDCSPVATIKILEKHKELDRILLKLENSIDSETMQKLNRISDEDLVEPETLAKKFLEEHNYFEEDKK